MKVTHIPFKKTGFFSKMMIDYLDKSSSLDEFYNNFPEINGYQNQIHEKKSSFTLESRKVLVDALKKQYHGFAMSELTTQNIDLLRAENTFTITTGHQLNLFTGPLYFLYKILSTINLCENLKEEFPNQNFVPIYWMATEDHDFDEINYFNFQGKKVSWNRNDGGAVGRFSTDGLQNVFEVFNHHLGNSKNATFLKNLFSKAYLEHSSLAEATRFLANELFAEYGLVIVDGDDKQLKQLFAPFVREELVHQTSYKEVSKTIEKLEESYSIQVNPREINLFYLGDDFRERIIFEDGVYHINNTDLSFSQEEILKELHENPKAFSPNVIMRPLYQELILPNLCYIGGGGEMAYWFELKQYFEKVDVPFPILLLRNSVQFVSEKQSKKLGKLNISFEELFMNQHELLSLKVDENSELELSFKERKQFLEKQFLELKEIATKTDKSFLNAVSAQEKKQLNGLDNLEKRLLRAEKRKNKDLVDRITALQNEILPNQSLEERQRNFSEYYLAYGDDFIKPLKEVLDPLKLEFTVLTL